MFLRELRKARGITMKELGDMLGVSESTISLYENGKREPSYELLLKIAEFFNVSVDYLLRGEDKKPVAPKDNERDAIKCLRQKAKKSFKKSSTVYWPNSISHRRKLRQFVARPHPLCQHGAKAPTCLAWIK